MTSILLQYVLGLLGIGPGPPGEQRQNMSEIAEEVRPKEQTTQYEGLESAPDRPYDSYPPK